MERNNECSRTKEGGEVTDQIFSHIVHLFPCNVPLERSLLFKFQVQKTFSHHREGERDKKWEVNA